MLDRSKLAPPMYLQIAGEIAHDIETKVLEIGDLVPSEHQLCEKYDVSRMTAKLALDELASMGYVERRRGKGTKVIWGKVTESLKEITSFTDEMRQNGIEMTTSYCSITQNLPSPQLCSLFQIPASQPVYQLERIRNSENRPLVYSVTSLNLQNLSLKPEDYMHSLYAYLKDLQCIVIAKAEDQLEATTADSLLAKKLEIKIGDPVFLRTRKGYNQYSKLIEYSTSFYAGDRYKYSIIL